MFLLAFATVVFNVAVKRRVPVATPGKIRTKPLDGFISPTPAAALTTMSPFADLSTKRNVENPAVSASTVVSVIYTFEKPNLGEVNVLEDNPIPFKSNGLLKLNSVFSFALIGTSILKLKSTSIGLIIAGSAFLNSCLKTSASNVLLNLVTP